MTRATAAQSGACIEALAARFGGRMTTALPVRQEHAGGEGGAESTPPDAVLFPRSIEDISAALALCNDHRMPVIPFGAGTSLEGQLDAVRGGVSLDLSGMNRVLDIHGDDFDCRVEAGVTREQLNHELRHSGLFFPIDPGANATLGGMAATAASGTNAVRYGTMREACLGVTAVLSDGRVFHTGSRARKSACGYDLTRLLVGSEGTLAVIAELQLRLAPIPEAIVAIVAQFPTLAAAVQAVVLLMQAGLRPARIELLDELQMSASIAYSRLERLAATPTLFIEVHGPPAIVAEEKAQVTAVAVALGATVQTAERPEARNLLWKARHDAYWAARALMPGGGSIVTDACVPLSKLEDSILAARREADAGGLTCPIVGHVGDGNFHMLILFDADHERQRAAAAALARRIGERAIACGGTCTGEHGVGLHKRALLARQHGTAIPVLAAIKHALDPFGILNPGKTLPEAARQP